MSIESDMTVEIYLKHEGIYATIHTHMKTMDDEYMRDVRIKFDNKYSLYKIADALEQAIVDTVKTLGPVYLWGSHR
jgi:hypothetical protein